MPFYRLTITAIFSVLLLGACNAAAIRPGGGRTSEEVLKTAQAKAEATRQATFQTPPPTPIPASPTVPLVTETPEPTLTPTPSRPVAIADFNAYIRSGPDAAYENIDFLLQGQQGFILGTFENEVNGIWWYIERIDEGQDGWVWSGAVTTSGDLIGVPVLEAPALNK
ncbi:MAG: SH3 domain-containing protein [Anaerolineales bacterium]|nr:SH3 domain-containing protein [Anaerolineales bacterium]